MSEAVPPSVSTDGSPIDSMHDASSAAGGVDVSAGGGDELHDQIDVRDEEETLHNEELNYERIGQSISHLDDSEYYLFDGEEDVPEQENPKSWTSIGLNNFAGFDVNSSKKKMWNRCKSELRDVGEQCKEAFRTGARRVNKEDIVKYFYGVDSPIWYVFRERLGWTHQKFLLFMTTNCRLSTCADTSAKLYNPLAHYNLDGIMEEEEYIACWRDICNVGKPSTTSSGANAETLFWIEIEEALNKMLKRLVIHDRKGNQVYLIDDDKVHYESHSRNHREWNVRILKHVRDNRWGMVVDTLCIPCVRQRRISVHGTQTQPIHIDLNSNADIAV